MRIIISGIFYPVTMMQYFINAFKRRNDVELFTVGPFHGNWIPWKGGMTLPERYVYTPDLPLPTQAMQYPVHSQMIKDRLPWKPDLWLQVDAGWHFPDRPLAEIVALVKTDPHAISPQHYDLPKRYSDFTFCMQTPYIQPREKYLPYAYDPTIHYPMDLPKEYDACLIGLQYEHRMNLVNALRKQGHTVFSEMGIVYDEYREAYNKGRVALSWSSLQDLPARVWEYAGMCLPIVTNRVPDLKTFFVEGEHYFGFDDIQEAVGWVKVLLENPKLAQTIAENAHRKVQIHHTWDARVNQILETVKLI